jgi:hypothetical protein
VEKFGLLATTEKNAKTFSAFPFPFIAPVHTLPVYYIHYNNRFSFGHACPSINEYD